MHSDVLTALLLSTPVRLTYHSKIMGYRFKSVKIHNQEQILFVNAKASKNLKFPK